MQTKENDYPIDGTEGAPIELKTAIQWTRNYRQMRPGERISHFFGKVHLHELLNQEGSMGIRIYYANSLRLNAWQRFILCISNFLRKSIAQAEGEEHLILVSSNRKGEDLLPGRREETTQPTTLPDGTQRISLAISSEPPIIEQSNPCPGSPGCPSNALTGG